MLNDDASITPTVTPPLRLITYDEETGVPYYNMGDLAPLGSSAVRGNPVAKAGHDAKVRAMLLRLLEDGWPDLMVHPRLADVLDSAIHLSGDRALWVRKLPDAQAQWGKVLGFCIRCLDR
ncbi:hypothetical protein SAMN04488144_116139 [Methylobacterium sp. 190mf]|uniref:hypothetical protein n=1 Tax=Methylobacterium sp. 190mf TaxID=1761798 RepID=UPI00089E46C6|nr:hypothetical protein [Methylobacterium sp. 190mf]SEG41483.1 hypothetical protein SAMN04488144_116139 [Methylobacterium sp. 190mf]